MHGRHEVQVGVVDLLEDGCSQIERRRARDDEQLAPGAAAQLRQEVQGYTGCGGIASATFKLSLSVLPPERTSAKVGLEQQNLLPLP
jgi:hypothetical protein